MKDEQRAGFIGALLEHRAIALLDADPAALLKKFDGWEAPRVEKWITRDET